jgi:hypothetical protein
LQGLNSKNTGTEITIDTPSGRTRLDIGSYDQESGELNLLEVKNGPGARLTPNQRACFPDIQNGNFTPAGQNAGNLGLSLEPGGGASSVNINIVNLNGANAQMPEAAAAAADAAAAATGEAAGAEGGAAVGEAVGPLIIDVIP